MNDRLAALVARLERVDQSDPDTLRGLLQDLALAEVVELVEAGYLSVERINHLGDVFDPSVEGGVRRLLVDPIMAQAVGEIITRQHQERQGAAALDALDSEPDLGIAVVLAGIDDPEAAIARLSCAAYTEDDAEGNSRPLTIDERGDVCLVDGYLYVRGVTSADLAAALAATRPVEPS